MGKRHIERLIDKGKAKASNVDVRGNNTVQAVVTSGKLRVVVTKDNSNGKTVN